MRWKTHFCLVWPTSTNILRQFFKKHFFFQYKRSDMLKFWKRSMQCIICSVISFSCAKCCSGSRHPPLVRALPFLHRGMPQKQILFVCQTASSKPDDVDGPSYRTLEFWYNVSTPILSVALARCGDLFVERSILKRRVPKSQTSIAVGADVWVGAGGI